MCRQLCERIVSGGHGAPQAERQARDLHAAAFGDGGELGAPRHGV